MKVRRKTITLPARGAVPDIDRFDIHKRHNVVPVHHIRGVIADRLGRVEPDRAAMHRIEIFEKTNHRRVRQHLAEKA
jgi:hypothetical protein